MLKHYQNQKKQVRSCTLQGILDSKNKKYTILWSILVLILCLLNIRHFVYVQNVLQLTTTTTTTTTTIPLSTTIQDVYHNVNSTINNKSINNASNVDDILSSQSEILVSLIDNTDSNSSVQTQSALLNRMQNQQQQQVDIVHSTNSATSLGKSVTIQTISVPVVVLIQQEQLKVEQQEEEEKLIEIKVKSQQQVQIQRKDQGNEPEDTIVQPRLVIGIFTTIEQYQQRQLYRKVIEQYNKKFTVPRICPLIITTTTTTTTTSNNNNHSTTKQYCQLYFTFVIGAADTTAVTTIVSGATIPLDILYTNKQDNNILQKTILDWNSSDVTLLNIRENVNDGKSQTWFYYATTVIEYTQQHSPEDDDTNIIDYIMKINIDTNIDFDRFFTFINGNSDTNDNDDYTGSLPPLPYNNRIVVSTFIDKSWWNLKQDGNTRRTEQFFSQHYQTMHLYFSSSLYILSIDVVYDMLELAKKVNLVKSMSDRTISESIETGNQNIIIGNRILQQFEFYEEHDICLLVQMSAIYESTDLPISYVMIPFGNKFWHTQSTTITTTEISTTGSSSVQILEEGTPEWRHSLSNRYHEREQQRKHESLTIKDEKQQQEQVKPNEQLQKKKEPEIVIKSLNDAIVQLQQTYFNYMGRINNIHQLNKRINQSIPELYTAIDIDNSIINNTTENVDQQCFIYSNGTYRRPFTMLHLNGSSSRSGSHSNDDAYNMLSRLLLQEDDNRITEQQYDPDIILITNVNIIQVSIPRLLSESITDDGSVLSNITYHTIKHTIRDIVSSLLSMNFVLYIDTVQIHQSSLLTTAATTAMTSTSTISSTNIDSDDDDDTVFITLSGTAILSKCQFYDSAIVRNIHSNNIVDKNKQQRQSEQQQQKHNTSDAMVALFVKLAVPASTGVNNSKEEDNTNQTTNDNHPSHVIIGTVQQNWNWNSNSTSNTNITNNNNNTSTSSSLTADVSSVKDMLLNQYSYQQKNIDRHNITSIFNNSNERNLYNIPNKYIGSIIVTDSTTVSTNTTTITTTDTASEIKKDCPIFQLHNKNSSMDEQLQQQAQEQQLPVQCNVVTLPTTTATKEKLDHSKNLNQHTVWLYSYH